MSTPDITINELAEILKLAKEIERLSDNSNISDNIKK